MKKKMDAVARWFGYMPISEATDAMKAYALKSDVSVIAARAEARHERAARRRVEREYAGTTSAAARELAAVTARIPLP